MALFGAKKRALFSEKERYFFSKRGLFSEGKNALCFSDDEFLSEKSLQIGAKKGATSL